MYNSIFYRTLVAGLKVGLAISLCVSIAKAQAPARGLTESDLYCSGMVTDQPISSESYLISGEDSSYKNTFMPGDLVYINRGSDQGVKMGDEFEVVRPVHDMMNVKWFRYQPMLSRAMGTMYGDIGRLRVVQVHPKTSTAQVRVSCDLMQRGDIIRPFQVRPVPAFHTSRFDPLAPPPAKRQQ